MLLLREEISLISSKGNMQILEDYSRTGELVFKDVILQRSDKPNANNRIYPYNTLYKELMNYQTLISQNRAYGTLDHADKSTVDLKESCWLVTKAWWDNNEIHGNLKVLVHHPNGKIIEGLLRDGATIGVSSRALGEVEKNNDGYDVVQNGLVLVSFDAVADPSTKSAFVNPQNITESVDNFIARNEHMRDKEYILIRELNQLICGKDRCDI